MGLSCTNKVYKQYAILCLCNEFFTNYNLNISRAPFVVPFVPLMSLIVPAYVQQLYMIIKTDNLKKKKINVIDKIRYSIPPFPVKISYKLRKLHTSDDSVLLRISKCVPKRVENIFKLFFNTRERKQYFFLVEIYRFIAHENLMSSFVPPTIIIKCNLRTTITKIVL